MNDSTSTTPLFEVQQLSKRYRVGGWLRPKHLHALRDVSFAIDRREIVALVGESGSGKSTVARLCVRLDNPTSGRMLLDGRDVLQDEPHHASLAYRKRVQMVFQDPFGSLNPVRTVGQHIERPIALHLGIRGHVEIRAKVLALLDAVGLSPAIEFVDKHPGELSGGQRQRVAIARALAPDPRIIFADEPVSMLDVSIRAGILSLLLDLKESRGISFVYITHDLASARYIADRTMVMYAGRIVEWGPTDDVLQDPQHPYTQLLVAAVPDIDKESPAALPARSIPPNIVDPSRGGCPFAPRCSRATAACGETMPPVVRLDARRFVRCHLFTDSPEPTAIRQGREES